MTERIREFLRNRAPTTARASSSTSTSCATTTRPSPRRCRTRRVFYAVKANPAPEVLSLLASLGSCFDTASVAEIEMALAAGATPDRISFGNTIKKERDIARAYRARRSPVRGRLRGRGREDRPRRARRAGCSAASSATAPAPNGRCRASSAASRRWRPTCSSTPTGSAWSRTASRSMSARSSATRRPGTARWRRRRRCSATARERGISLSMVNLGGGFPTKYLQGRAGGEDLRPVDLPRAAQAFRQPHPGDDHRAGPRHGRQCRHHRGRGRADLEEERRATTCAGSISTSASSAVSPRRWTSRSATRSARRATATRWRPACSPARPATRPTCCTRRQPYPLPVSLEIGDKVLIEGTGAYTTTYSSVAFNGFPPLKTYHI